MPRRKKEPVSDDDAGTGDTKRVKMSPPELDGGKVRIDWEGDASKWTMYNDDSMRVVVDAIEKDKKQIPLSLGGTDFLIDVVKSVQKNKTTGWERRLRLCSEDTKNPGDYRVWEYQDGKKQWQPHAILAQRLIEKTADDDDCEVLVGRTKWQVNKSEEEMTKKGPGNKTETRKIRATLATAEQPLKVEPGTSGATAAKSGTKRAKSGKPSASGDADDVDVKPSAKSGAKKSGGTVKTDPDAPKVKSVIVKGKAPVDPECTSKVDTAHVYCEGNDVYDAMLNQTNLQNNNNKYYICQLLEDDTARRYTVWFRWGRVGKTGQNSMTPCGPDLENAKNIFMKKFEDKTKNSWSTRNSFVKVAGKYDLLHMDYGADEAVQEESTETKVKREIPDSVLDIRVQNLIKLICDVKNMEEAVMEMKYDSKKAPLGKLTPAQIKAGYSALKAIDDCIQGGKTSGPQLLQACNDFYTRVPHDFGMQRPPLIRSREEVKLKLQLLDALGDIQIAMTMLREDARSSDNPVDRHYKSLEVQLEPVAPSSEEFEMVNEYLQNTHAATHSNYKMVLKELFHCDKDEEKKKFKDCGNRQLLWHGSRLTNWVGILKQGLRIAPPEAPVTGYMFGKGVYFADMSSKSANYCFTTRSKNTGLVLLCDVALGKCNEKLEADYKADKLPSGCHSVKGLGSVAPDPSGTITRDGLKIPKGKATGTGVVNPSGYTLNYNEYIVYNTNQIRMKYLCKIEMKY